MKNRKCLVVLSILSLLIARGSSLYSQIVGDSTTVTLNGVTTNIVGNMYIGTNGPFTKLIITNGASLTNSGFVYVGFQTTSKSNLVVLTGVGSVWSANAIFTGVFADFNELIVTNGGRIEAGGGIGDFGGDYNSATITGIGSQWSMPGSDIAVGMYGATNQLVVSGGGMLMDSGGIVGRSDTAHHNAVVIKDAGSQWVNRASLIVGSFGSTNSLIVTNGGIVTDATGIIGSDTNAIGNQVLVTGANSVWTNRLELSVGRFGSKSQMMVANRGTVTASNLFVGFGASALNGTVTVSSGGKVIVTNTTGRGVTDVRRGVFVLNSGLLNTDILLVTNNSQFVFNSGTLQIRSATNDAGATFVIGDGVSEAILELLGGNSRFANGLKIANGGQLKGYGTIFGSVTNDSGGTLAPGPLVGSFAINSTLVLAAESTNMFELDCGARTNDNVTGLSTVVYDGLLIVTNLGGMLTSGDNFKLFSAEVYSGSFGTISLPVLAPGLLWTNKLLIDGSIQVLGPVAPYFEDIYLSGTNVILIGAGGSSNNSYVVLTSTNVVLPLSNWSSIATNQFGPGGEFAFTNGFVLQAPQCYFRIRTP